MMAASRSAQMVKILFELEPDAWHENATETVWAEAVASGRYRLRNTPFFAFGIGVEDVVFANEADDGALTFVGVSLQGGHSTYRIMRATDDDQLFQRYWQALEQLGCTYEQGPVLAVDVPPKVDIYIVYGFLEKGEADEVWQFEEGHCGHPLQRVATVDST